MGGDAPPRKVADAPAALSELLRLAAEAMDRPSLEGADYVLKCAVEYARETLGFERCGIFLWDAENDRMIGTWGTDTNGNTADEHDLTYQHGSIDREVHERAQRGLPWTLYENVPLVAHRDDRTEVIRNGWLGCTAILGSEHPYGILFNDTAVSGAPFDEARQWRAAILCSLLGRVLDECGSFFGLQTRAGPHPRHPVVRHVTSLLMEDPRLTCKAIAKKLNLSHSSLARVFKRETKSSIVDYRNDLRLNAVLDRLDAEASNLLEAALEAGFGSYAQFARVFRARLGQSPREYVRTHHGKARGLVGSNMLGAQVEHAAGQFRRTRSNVQSSA